jgi:folylpolyglutamate synthase
MNQRIEQLNDDKYSCRHLVHGRFTSPHLVDRWDCITITQKPVEFKTFRAIEHEVLRRNTSEGIGASEFELLTATAFQLFTEEKVDVAVVEVGMGGRLDATNIVGLEEGIDKPSAMRMDSFRPHPLVTAISSIGLDHQAFLGNTLADIAREKAGIIKPGVPVVYDGSNDEEVVQVLRDVAFERNSPLITWDGPTEPSTAFKADCRNYLDKLSTQYRFPQHVYRNATVAFIATWTALAGLGRLPSQSYGLPISDGWDPRGGQLQPTTDLAQRMMDVIPTTTFPGRQQMISIEKLTGRKEDVLLDGAHNAQSANALASATDELRRTSKAKSVRTSITWVLAASDTKDAKEILSSLLQRGDSVFAVEFGPVDGMPWVNALPADRLVEAASAVLEKSGPSRLNDCDKDLVGALRAASQSADGGPLVIAGSLYLVGDVLRLLRDNDIDSSAWWKPG